MNDSTKESYACKDTIYAGAISIINEVEVMRGHRKLAIGHNNGNES
jgi:hemin uptake protein HemP